MQQNQQNQICSWRSALLSKRSDGETEGCREALGPSGFGQDTKWINHCLRLHIVVVASPHRIVNAKKSEQQKEPWTQCTHPRGRNNICWSVLSHNGYFLNLSSLERSQYCPHNSKLFCTSFSLNRTRFELCRMYCLVETARFWSVFRIVWVLTNNQSRMNGGHFSWLQLHSTLVVLSNVSAPLCQR